MGQLTNQYVSQSYQGLIKLADSTTGVTSTLQYTQDGLGNNLPLQISTTQVNITGSFTVNGVPFTNGTNGTSGTSGQAGTSGSSGTSGGSGSSGSSGTSGVGTNGSSGTSGTNGIAGSSGTSGTDGQNGSSGTSGANGTSGSDGTSGSSGTAGSSGTSPTFDSGSFATTGSNVFIGNQTITGSLYSSDIIGTGSVFIQPNQSDVRYLEVYNTSPTDTHITASGGQLFIGDDTTYVKVDNYGTVKRIDIIADNGVYISSSLTVTGSIDITGDYYINGVAFSGGTNGTSGTSGQDGSSGTSGIDGSSGTSGSDGSSGTSGSSGSSGSNGTSGTSGSSGQNGISNSFFNYQAKTTITSGDPGSGHIIWNNATQSGATFLNVSDVDQNGDNIDIFLGNLSAGSVITIQDQANQGNYQKWTLGTPVDNGTYYTYPVTLVAATHSFSNNDPILFIIVSTPSGTSGSSGTSGQNGTSGSSGTNGTDGTSGSSGSSGSSGASPFAQTGSFYNTTNNIGITGSLNVRGGDVDIISNNTTVNNELYLTSSLSGQSNIILGWGDSPALGGTGLLQANYSGSLRITGSNNIVAMPQLRATGLSGGADQTGYISGSNNIINTNQGGIFLNTGSLLFPKTQNNIINSPNAIRLDFTTSSLAGGHPIVNNNILNNGFLTITSNSGSINANNNALLGGNVTSTQNFENNNKVNINNNILNGAVTLNHISSSVSFNNNIGNGGVTLNNHLSSSAIANNFLQVTNNTFLGNNGGVAGRVGIYVSGSQSSNTQRQINDNLVGGRQNVISSSFVSSSASNLNATIIYGNSLAVSGSHTGDGGSAFFGRFNATGSLQESSQDTVFVVGTGTGAASRRNALRIDSNNNSNFTGSVNISGSLTLNGVTVTSTDRNGLITTGSIGGTQSITGSVIVSGSQTITGSIDVTGQYLVNGVPISSGDRNGLITTGSAFGTQVMTGSLDINGGTLNVNNAVSITSGTLSLPATNAFMSNANLEIVSGNLNLKNAGIAIDRSIVFNGSNNFTGSTPTYVEMAQLTPQIWSFTNVVTSAPQSGSNFFLSNNNTDSAGLTFQAVWSGSVASFDISNTNGATKIRGLSNSVLFAKNEGFPNTSSDNFQVDANNIKLSGSVNITGSVKGNVNALSISSQTASLDLNTGNFFTLQLVSGSATHINPSNIAAGQTVNIRLSTTGSGTVTFPSSVDQVSGSAYVPTTTTGTDIITLVSFDSSTLYLASVKNLI